MTETHDLATAPDTTHIKVGDVVESTIEVESLDDFVRILTQWHISKTDTVKHLLEVPEGTTFEVGDGGKTVVLAGSTLAGFKFGLEMALMQLGNLPFVAEIEDDEPATSGG